MYGDPVTIEGSELLARAIQHETDHLDGVLFIDRLDTDARKAAMREIRESDWFGPRSPWSRSARTAPTGSVLHDLAMRLVFAGTPEVALPPSTPSPRPTTTWSASSPAPTHPPGAAASSRQPGGQRAEELGVPVLKPSTRGTRASSSSCATSPPTAARLSRTAPCCPSRRWTSRRRAGSTCTSPASPPGAVRRRCSTRSGRATRSPAPPRSGSSRSSTPGPTYGVMTERIRPTDTAGDLLARLAEGGAGLLVATLDGIADGSPRGPRPAESTGSASPRRSRSRTRASTGSSPRRPSTAGSAPARPPRARGPRYRGSGSRSARSTAVGDLEAGDLQPCTPRRTPSWSAPARRPCGWARSRPSAAADAGGRLGAGTPGHRADPVLLTATVTTCRGGARGRRRDPEVVDAICRGLPEVELGTSWGDVTT